MAWSAITQPDALERKPPTQDGIDQEREKGFEPSTPTLATWCSTPELLPHVPTQTRRCARTTGKSTSQPSRLNQNQYSAATRECKPSSEKARTSRDSHLGFPFAYRARETITYIQWLRSFRRLQCEPTCKAIGTNPR